MGGPKPLRPNAGDEAQLIRDLDEQAHEEYEVSLMLDRNAQLDGKIANRWGHLGETGAAKRARTEQMSELEQSDELKEQVDAELAEEELLERIASERSGSLPFQARIPQLRAAIDPLQEAIRANTAEGGQTRRAADQAYLVLMEKMGQPVENHAATVALLGALEAYIKQAQPIAHENRDVRAVWVRQARLIEEYI